MELKKSIILFILLLVVLMSLPVSANENKFLSFGRIKVNMPEISAEIKGSGYNVGDISATFDSKPITVESVDEYNKAKNSTLAYVVIDLSTSMYNSFDLIKQNIVSYINKMNNNDKLVLLTIGETKVNVELNGSENRESAIKVVKELKCNENGTLFYEALNQAYKMSAESSNDFDREYVLVFSDGIDYQKGNSTFDEVKENYKNQELPLYAACSPNATKDAADSFGKIARLSGGDFSIVKNKNDFSDLIKTIDDVSIIKLNTNSNKADGKQKLLTIKIGERQVEKNIFVTRSIADNTPPKVKKVLYDISKDAFVFSYSEAVKGANSEKSYKFVAPNGKKVDVSSVFYSQKDDTYEVKLKEAVIKGQYTVTFSGITDTSKEENKLLGSKNIKVNKVKDLKKSNIKSEKAGMSNWLIIIIVFVVLVLIIAIVLIIIFLNKRKNNITNGITEKNSNVESEECTYYDKLNMCEKHHIKLDKSLKLKLNIKTGNVSEQQIETTIVSSMIVGRSSTCDIFIDDPKLSRQHFVIECTNGELYVTDLNSKNGTMINGIRIFSKQKLNNGDKILAGLSDIIITIIGG